jgi:hypothetical protein
MRNSSPLSVLTILAILASSTACATIVRRKTQRIPVTSAPIGARVSINGESQGITPVEIELRRGLKSHVIRIEYDGYDPVELRSKRKLSPGPVIGNIMLGVIPAFFPAMAWKVANDESPDPVSTMFLIWGAGAVAVGGILTAIDSMGPGKGYELRPTELVVTLTKTKGIPHVDTIFVDPDDFKNIVWIRVRS